MRPLPECAKTSRRKKRSVKKCQKESSKGRKTKNEGIGERREKGEKREKDERRERRERTRRIEKRFSNRGH